MGCGLLLWVLVTWNWVSKRTTTLVIVVWVCSWHGRCERAWSMMAVGGGCRHFHGRDMACHCHVAVVAESGCVAADVGPTRHLAHGGRSQHVAVVTSGSDGLVVGGGRRECCVCVW